MIATQFSFDPFTRTPSGRKSRRRPRSERETALVAACVELLHLRGLLHWRANGGAISGRRPDGSRYFVKFNSIALPDLLAVFPGGRLLGCECKLVGNHPTPSQAEFISALNAIGGIGVVIFDVADLAAIIDRETGR